MAEEPATEKRVSIPTGPPRPFRCYARRIAWQAKKSNTFRASLFLGTPRRKQCGHNLSFFLVHVASSVLRESLLRPAITATLGALLSLHDKQHRIGRRWSSDYFYFMNVRTLARAKDHSGMESVLLKISPFYAPDNTTIQRTQVIQLIQTIQVIQTALEIHWHHAFLMSQSLPSCQCRRALY